MTSTGEARAPRRWRRWVLCAAGVLAMGVIAPLGWLGYESYVAEREFQRQLAAIRSQGEPVSVSELDSFYIAPASNNNVTALWRQAGDTIEPTGPNAKSAIQTFLSELGSDAEHFPIFGSPGPLPAVGEPWPQLENAERLLARLKTPLDQIHEATRRGGRARFKLDFNEGLGLPFPHLHQLRTLALLLSLEAHVHAHRDRPARAVQSIHVIFMVARSLEHEPALVSHLVRISCYHSANDVLQKLLPVVIFSDEDLQQLQADLRGVDWSAGLRRALTGERVSGIEIFRDPKNLEKTGIDEERFRQLGPNRWRVTRQQDFALYVDLNEKLISATRSPWPAAINLARLTQDELKSKDGNRLPFYLSNMLLASLDQAFVLSARAQAMGDVTDTAIAIERYRSHHGELPSAWAELVPEFMPHVATGPFDGEPLRYKRTDEHYLLYSLGPDGNDDGGEVGPGDRSDDVTFVGPIRRAIPARKN